MGAVEAYLEEYEAGGSRIPPNLTANPVEAQICAANFLVEEDRGDRFWPEFSSETMVWRRLEDQPLITLTVAHIFRRRAFYNYQARLRREKKAGGGKPLVRKGMAKRPRSPRSDDGSNSKNEEDDMDLVINWTQSPMRFSRKRCIQYLKHIDPQNDGEDLREFTTSWLAQADAPWPLSADKRLQGFMHSRNFYFSVDLKEGIIRTLINQLRRGTELEAYISGSQYSIFNQRVVDRIECCTKQFATNRYLEYDKLGGPPKKTKQFRDIWNKRQEHWKGHPAYLGDPKPRKRRRKAKPAKPSPSSPIVFPNIMQVPAEGSSTELRLMDIPAQTHVVNNILLDYELDTNLSSSELSTPSSPEIPTGCDNVKVEKPIQYTTSYMDLISPESSRASTPGIEQLRPIPVIAADLKAIEEGTETDQKSEAPSASNLARRIANKSLQETPHTQEDQGRSRIDPRDDGLGVRRPSDRVNNSEQASTIIQKEIHQSHPQAQSQPSPVGLKATRLKTVPVADSQTSPSSQNSTSPPQTSTERLPRHAGDPSHPPSVPTFIPSFSLQSSVGHKQGHFSGSIPPNTIRSPERVARQNSNAPDSRQSFEQNSLFSGFQGSPRTQQLSTATDPGPPPPPTETQYLSEARDTTFTYDAHDPITHRRPRPPLLAINDPCPSNFPHSPRFSSQDQHPTNFSRESPQTWEDYRRSPASSLPTPNSVQRPYAPQAAAHQGNPSWPPQYIPSPYDLSVQNAHFYSLTPQNCNTHVPPPPNAFSQSETHQHPPVEIQINPNHGRTFAQNRHAYNTLPSHITPKPTAQVQVPNTTTSQHTQKEAFPNPLQTNCLAPKPATRQHLSSAPTPHDTQNGTLPIQSEPSHVLSKSTTHHNVPHMRGPNSRRNATCPSELLAGSLSPDPKNQNNLLRNPLPLARENKALPTQSKLRLPKDPLPVRQQSPSKISTKDVEAREDLVTLLHTLSPEQNPSSSRRPYVYVPEPMPFSKYPSAEETALMKLGHNSTDKLSTDTRLGRPLVTNSEPLTGPRLDLVLQKADRTLDWDNLLPSGDLNEIGVHDFFKIYSLRTGVPLPSLTSLTFSTAFGDREALVVHRNWGEEPWKRFKKRLKNLFFEGKRSNPDEKYFEAWVKIGDTTSTRPSRDDIF